MAEVIVPFVIDKLTSLISPYIVEEFNLQTGVSKELTFIKNELQIITAFLRDAENRAERSDAVKEWVKQVRNVAYRIENAIDEHVMVSIKVERTISTTLKCLSCVCIPELKQRHDIASLISDVKAEISEIQQRRIAYGLQVIEQVGQDAEKDVWYDPRAGFLYPRDSDLVGLEDPKIDIFKLLSLEAKDSRCSVLAMVGMGGIGKTTLALKVYNDFEVKKSFDVHAWVNVTQSYNMKDVFKNMIQGFYKSAMQPIPSHVAQMNEEMSLINELRDFLQNKRFLVIFDDVWDLMLWNHVKNAFPDSKGSKIVLTTRQDSVALTWKESWIENNIYKLKLLDLEKAWELFCKKAFQGDQCPQWLEEISKSIVSKCEGLPLALVTLGALLSTRAKVFAEWKRFHDSLGSELEQNPQLSNNISKILLLSYKGLPHFLKPCLLYFCLFPESSSIESNRLIKLWTAEDFIKGKRGVSIEDVAKEYLIELIQRNLVQVSTWYDCGRIRNVRVHDLIFEVLNQKRGELDFCQIITMDEVNEVDVKSRRLSIQKGGLDNALKSISSINKCSARSFLLFGAQELTSIALLSSSLLKKIYLLKVLDLQGAVLDQIPKEVGDLSLLQYLSLRYTKVKTIPKTIGKLKNLLTLDLKRCPVWELPIEVGHLRKLRHLVVYQNTWNNTLKKWEIGAVKILGEVFKYWENLQKLADVNVATSAGFMDQLGKFTMLKYLAISNVKRDNSWNLCKAIEKLICLESLNISVDSGSADPLDLQHVISPPLQLQRLYLIGPLDKFPSWIGELENLNKLRFRGSKLVDIPLNILQNLPNLTMLGINEGVYYGEQLVFQTGGFQKLKSMYFDALLNLNSFEIQLGALPLLEDLLIHRSPNLKEVPVGLQYLEKLASLKLVEMPQEFVMGISSIPSIVNRVADIRVGYQTPTGIYIYKKL